MNNNLPSEHPWHRIERMVRQHGPDAFHASPQETDQVCATLKTIFMVCGSLASKEANEDASRLWSDDLVLGLMFEIAKREIELERLRGALQRQPMQ